MLQRFIERLDPGPDDVHLNAIEAQLSSAVCHSPNVGQNARAAKSRCFREQMSSVRSARRLWLIQAAAAGGHELVVRSLRQRGSAPHKLIDDPRATALILRTVGIRHQTDDDDGPALDVRVRRRALKGEHGDHEEHRGEDGGQLECDEDEDVCVHAGRVVLVRRPGISAGADPGCGEIRTSYPNSSLSIRALPSSSRSTTTWSRPPAISLSISRARSAFA